ncbi:DUF1592 domain-containing protein [Planctomicrobium sp.]|nr:DUF1592 domain-containing protein [Planctomicrobium sp.]MDB4733263.1 DUF1592 domain-containing protein [Planctomicrobium sp.]
MICTTSQSFSEDASTQRIDPVVVDYFKQYCYRCHGDSQQKGDRRFDEFPKSLHAESDSSILLEEALDAINRGDMPPRKDGVPQPQADDTRRIVATLTQLLNEISNAKAIPTTVMRRLNRFEYVNTMSDLLGLRREFFSLTSDFPVDAVEHGFDNNGETLTLSDHQLQRYLEVAKASLDAASFFERDRPQRQQWQYTAKDFNGVDSYERAPVTWRLNVGDEYLEIGHGQPSERHPNFVKKFVSDGGTPEDGWYTVRVKASAANRIDHDYDHTEFERYRIEPLKMALWIAPSEKLLAKNAADQRHLVKVWDLPDEEPNVFTERIWLGKGAIPFLSWTNGISSKGNIRRVAEKHHPEVIRATKTQRDAAILGNPEAKELVERLVNNRNNKLLSEVYHGPRIRVWKMDIEGPDYPDWPPEGHKLLFGTETNATAIDLEQVTWRFANRAFRRPVRLDEIQHYVDFMRSKISNGVPNPEAIKQGFAAILTSPRFLYLDEGNDEGNPELAPYELASRLSYFLWSTMPDEELFAAAESGRLMAPEEFERQVQRMLSDSQSEAFVEHFTDSWLRINTLGSMPPDLKAFEQYYRDRLQEFYKTETRMFFKDLMVRNESIINFLESHYTFLNGPLASQYGIKGVHGEQFRKVTLKPEDHRGGLLGQGSVLTLTANGIETSPVVRGIWVLENILGTPPPPPPPDVEPLEPDTRGTTTIREQLDKHRNVATCAECHRRIDPAGFALEFYDPIGGYRIRYSARNDLGPAVDGSGQLPTGEVFQDERELKQLLVARKDQFAETLVEKLLTYGTGRTMTFRDNEEIKRIATKCADNGYGLRDLIISVTTSEIFRNR